MSGDEVEADELAPSRLDGTYYRATIRKAPVCGVRRSGSVGQAVAIGRRDRQAVGAERMTIREKEAWIAKPTLHMYMPNTASRDRGNRNNAAERSTLQRDAGSAHISGANVRLSDWNSRAARLFDSASSTDMPPSLGLVRSSTARGSIPLSPQSGAGPLEAANMTTLSEKRQSDNEARLKTARQPLNGAGIR